MCIVVGEIDADRALAVLAAAGEHAPVIGRVVKGLNGGVEVHY
jgi:phosphoribosylaminoimidazole (AIR) synthetase